MGKLDHENFNQRKARVAILISDKECFITMNIP